MQNKKFDLIVFDWDGTLMNSTMTIVRCIQSAARDCDLTVPGDDVAAFVIGLSLSNALQYVFPKATGSQQAQLFERFRYHYLSQHHQLELFNGVEALLKKLVQAEFQLAIATGASRAGLNRALEMTGVGSYFDATICADESFSKPHPAMLQEITASLGVDLQRTIMIGDTTHDLQMAKNAGVIGVAVEYGAHDVAALRAMNPIYSASSVNELQAWLLEQA